MSKMTDRCLSKYSHRNTWLIFFTLIAGMACPTYAQTSVRKLTSEDYAQILQLYFKYPLTLDSGDSLGFANLFTKDGAFGDHVVGRKALIRFADRKPSSTIRQAPLTPLIIPTAEGAKGVVTNLFIDVSKSPAVIVRVTQYTDTLVKTPDGWRFKKRVNGTAQLGKPDATTSMSLK